MVLLSEARQRLVLSSACADSPSLIASSMAKFLDEVLAGRARPEDVDDWVEAWHESPAGSGELHDFLGLTWEEYGLWARDPEAIHAILSARQSFPGA